MGLFLLLMLTIEAHGQTIQRALFVRLPLGCCEGFTCLNRGIWFRLLIVFGSWYGLDSGL